jgi:hypothetical protein
LEEIILLQNGVENGLEELVTEVNNDVGLYKVEME